MKPDVPGGRPVAWEDAGQQIAPVLGSYSAVVITSSDPVAAAHVALGIALAEAKHKRVVVGDLIGDVTPLRSLVKDEDPHGISDSLIRASIGLEAFDDLRDDLDQALRCVG